MKNNINAKDIVINYSEFDRITSPLKPLYSNCIVFA